ncbi:MAG: threonine ammonia-lyase [Anaerolineae bacterium]|nr:threonine ammonia-lyase [Thermoflexales bacterium]MDW8396500.1 threonine ammonia-lyase [Anaerolineae bacterium]
MDAVTLADIHAAQQTLRDQLIATPMLPELRLSRMTGARVFFKAESLQRGGSFKIRGAYNKIAHLSEQERKKGVITASAGNHAQGVALAARIFNVPATIVMPEFAPLTKVVSTRNFGAEVILHGASFDDAVDKARELQAAHDLTFVHAFDDPLVIAGQGTIGMEVMAALPELEVLVVPIGGGGLISGIGIAVKALKPSVRLIGVQASACAPVRASLQAGQVVTANSANTIADGIAVKRPSELTLHYIRALVDDVVEVSDDDIARGIAHCAQHARLVVEGAGAAGVAAVLADKVALQANETVCIVLCGGNIDSNLLARVIEQVMVQQGRIIVLRLTVLDRPGQLAAVINHVAACGANIIDVIHRRAVWLAPLTRTGLELVLEVRDEAHGQEVVDRLEHAGYHVERVRLGEWPA